MADQTTPPWFSEGMMQMAKLPNLLKKLAQQPEPTPKYPNRQTAYPKKPQLHFHRLRPLGTLHPLHTVKAHGNRPTRRK